MPTPKACPDSPEPDRSDFLHPDSGHPPTPVRAAGLAGDLETCEVFGDICAAPDPWVVLGGITAGGHVVASAADPAPGWWQSQAAPVGVLDPETHPFLGMGWGAPQDPTDCPESTTGQAEKLRSRLREVGVERPVTIIGASYGAMVAAQFGVLYPEACTRLVLVGGGPNPHPFGVEWRRLQRAVVELGGGSAESLSLARQLALLSYRCPADFARRESRAQTEHADGSLPDGLLHGKLGVESWLRDCGAEFAQRYSADVFCGLSQAVDDHRIDPEQLTVPTTVIGIRPDLVGPAESLREFADKVPGGRYLEFESEYGHDAFLKDPVPMARSLRDALGWRQAPETRAVHAGLNADPSGAVTPPIHLTSTFRWNGIGSSREFDYSRTANPTRSLLGDALADLEGGSGSVVTSSGMSAGAVALALCAADDVVLFPHDAYGGTWRLITRLAAQGKLRAEAVDFMSVEGAERIRQVRPRMVWVETPSNPLLRITDLAAVASACREVGALLCVDNTMLSPGWQNPLAWGADLVVHSCTKYVAGHSDVVSGAVVCATSELVDECAWWANCLGVTGSPHDSWLVTRGLRTLPVRLAAHQRGTDALVAALLEAPGVRQVHYPGLSDHPQHQLAARQQKAFGAVVSFELHGGLAAAHSFVDHLDVFTLAVSLGGVESLVNHPATMTHAAMTEEAQRAAGIHPGLLRLSVGIEHPDDIVAAVTRAGRASEGATR